MRLLKPAGKLLQAKNMNKNKIPKFCVMRTLCAVQEESIMLALTEIMGERFLLLEQPAIVMIREEIVICNLTIKIYQLSFQLLFYVYQKYNDLLKSSIRKSIDFVSICQNLLTYNDVYSFNYLLFFKYHDAFSNSPGFW